MTHNNNLICKVHLGKESTLTGTIGENVIRFNFDTGSPISMINMATYEKIKGSVLEEVKEERYFPIYNGHQNPNTKIYASSRVFTKIKFNNGTTLEHSLLVVDGWEDNIIGMDLFENSRVQTSLLREENYEWYLSFYATSNN